MLILLLESRIMSRYILKSTIAVLDDSNNYVTYVADGKLLRICNGCGSKTGLSFR